MRSTKDETAAVREAASSLYGCGQEIWSHSDKWNAYKHFRVDSFCRSILEGWSGSLGRMLDVGAGRDGYDWIPESAVRLDRFACQVERYSLPVAGEVENLPFVDGSFDTTICVGSVINYASAIEAVAELLRVTKRGGFLILHFETSTSFEHVGTNRWGVSAAPLDTLNSSRADHIWVYSPNFIRASIRANGGRIQKAVAFHILSSLGLRLGWSQDRASQFARLDAFLPFLGKFADDVIFLVGKNQ